MSSAGSALPRQPNWNHFCPIVGSKTIQKPGVAQRVRESHAAAARKRHSAPSDGSPFPAASKPLRFYHPTDLVGNFSSHTRPGLHSLRRSIRLPGTNRPPSRNWPAGLRGPLGFAYPDSFAATDRVAAIGYLCTRTSRIVSFLSRPYWLWGGHSSGFKENA